MFANEKDVILETIRLAEEREAAREAYEAQNGPKKWGVYLPEEKALNDYLMTLDRDAVEVLEVLRLREVYPNIKLECALPCVDQTEKWHDEQIERYSGILKKADKVYYSSDKEYFRDCMNLRNKYMVDNSDLLLAVWNGKKGGTANTVKYARKKEKEVVIINPDTF